MIDDALDNTIGLSKLATWSNDFGGLSLTSQLTEANVAFETVDLPYIVGVAGCAWLLGYRSPKTGSHVTTLIVPLSGIDTYAEEYYIFLGLDLKDAAAFPDWSERYDICREMNREVFRRDMAAKAKQ